MAVDLDSVAPTPEHATFLRDTLEAVAAEREAPEFPHDEIERITRLAGRFSVGAAPWPLREQVAMVAARSVIDLDVPTASAVPGGAQLKVGIKRAVSWYLRHVASQVTELGDALVRFATATATEVERLDRELADLREELGLPVADESPTSSPDRP